MVSTWVMHRDGDQPALIEFDGLIQIWCQCGMCHRDDDRPAAILYDGTQEWYQHFMRHRSGGQPAVIHANGDCEWWMFNRQFDHLLLNQLPLPLSPFFDGGYGDGVFRHMMRMRRCEVEHEIQRFN